MNFDQVERLRGYREVGLDDKFRFNCTKCGMCCKNRDDILLNPYDVYRAAKALGITTKDIVMRRRGIDELTERDFSTSIKQKGVDMKIGMDIASLAYKKQVDQIVLIAGDADFVPAAKLARREGIDVVLDPLGHGIKDDLFVHIDGKRSCGDPYSNRRSENREEGAPV